MRPEHGRRRNRTGARGAVRNHASDRTLRVGRAIVQNQRRLPPEIELKLDGDPLFKITTSDGRFWFDPYSGRAVEAGGNARSAAWNYLVDQRPWESWELLGLPQLQFFRWRSELTQLLPSDPRFRLFAKDGRGWLNPYSGELVPGVRLEENRLTQQALTAMSQALAACPLAGSGVLRELGNLKERFRKLGLDRTEQGDRQTDLERDLNRAKDIQTHMLSELPELPGYEFAVHFAPHAHLSGDFYEFLPLGDGRLLLLLGDVSGHGVQAALIVATFLKTLRMLARETQDLVDLLDWINVEIKRDLLPSQFITVCAAILDPNAHTIDVVLAGHHPLLVINPDSQILLQRVGRKGVALGLVQGSLFRQSLHPVRYSLIPGDLMVQYTDGVEEAINTYDESFDLVGVSSSLFSHLLDGPQKVVDGVAADAAAFAGGTLADDVTLIAVHRCPTQGNMTSDDPERTPMAQE